MKRTMRRVPSTRILVSLILAITAALGLVSAILIAFPTPPQSPTATHTGYVAVGYTGVYHYVIAQPLCNHNFPPCLAPGETVFYLVTGNEAVRLFFYCGLDFCYSAQQLPFRDGDKVSVKGTLLEPSDWETSKYQPTLQFIGDLYVLNYTIA